MKFRELFFRQEKKPRKGYPARGTCEKIKIHGYPAKGCPYFFVGAPKIHTEVIYNEGVKNGKKGERDETA